MELWNGTIMRHWYLILQDESQSPGAESSDDGGGSEERSNHIQPLKLKNSVTNIGMESSSIRSDGIVGANGFGGPSPAKRPRSKLYSLQVQSFI